MTERLAIKRNNGDCVLKGESCLYGWYSFDVSNESLRKESLELLEKAFYKLAEYENAEEEGRLVVLPCKVGDTVYQLFVTDIIDKKIIYKIFQSKVTRIIIDRFRTIFSFETLDENKYKSELTMESFGETVFLTREETDKTLNEIEVNYGKR